MSLCVSPGVLQRLALTGKPTADSVPIHSSVVLYGIKAGTEIWCANRLLAWQARVSRECSRAELDAFAWPRERRRAAMWDGQGLDAKGYCYFHTGDSLDLLIHSIPIEASSYE